MLSFLAPVTGFVGRLASGGALEIILLIVIIVVALILFLVALWILWKLLVLLGKGLLWLFRGGSDLAKGRAAARREARLAAPPPVATGWGSPPGISLRRALREAAELAGPDAIRIVVVAGDGFVDICRSLKLTPPGVGVIGVAAGADVVLIDATRTDRMALRRLANTLPWWRAADGAAVLVSPDEVPGEAISRAAAFARATGMRTALHFSLPSASDVGAWQIIDAHHRDAAAICSMLAVDSAAHWLAGGSREGLESLALAQTRGLPGSLGRAMVAAPSSVLDLASLCFGGVGLRGAVSQTVDRTRPAPTPSLAMWAGAATFLVGLGLAALVAVNGLNRAVSLEAAVDTAAREAAVSWNADGIAPIPSPARVRRVAGLGVRLADFSGFSFLMPMAVLTPDHDAPRELGELFLTAYVLRPVATALDRRIREMLEPGDDPRRWIDQARLVSEWMAAWEGLDDDPREVDLRRLFAVAFDGDESAWSEGVDFALLNTGARPPPPSEGGLDIDALTTLAQSNFVTTMQRWADKVYTNGPIASAARQAVDRSLHWREQRAALSQLRTLLQDPQQSWLTATRDRPDHAFELPILGRAIALSLFGTGTALEAKAEVSRLRIEARDAVQYFNLPGIGPLFVRSSSGAPAGGGGPSLALSVGAGAWLAFLDRIEGAGFADASSEPADPVAGLATVDPTEIGESRERLRKFDQFAATLPADLPPAAAQGLLRTLAGELVAGVATGVERALRPRGRLGSAGEQAEQLARIAPTMEDMGEIEAWLRDRSFPEAADRVSLVRSQVATSVLEISVEALFEEDPLGVRVDPSADADALIRRFERGLARFRQMHDQLAAPFIDASAQTGEWVAIGWQNIALDLKSYDQGQVDTTLTGLEGMVRAYAEDANATCEAPRTIKPSGREDYAAFALERFRDELDIACERRTTRRAKTSFKQVADYVSKNINGLWPFAANPDAAEIPAPTMGEYVRLVHKAQDDLARLDTAGAASMVADADFWDSDEDGGAIVRFRVFWRARPGEELLAENLFAIDIEGAEVDEDGIYTWRYGSPFAIRMQLAKNSSLRFANGNGEGADARSVTKTRKGEGNGGLLRVFADLSQGALSLEEPVVDEDGRPATLRVTARIAGADGAPLSIPKFDERSDSILASLRTLED